MTGEADAILEAAITARVAASPADVVDLARVAADAIGPAFSRCEGDLHSLVHRLVRAGRLVPVGRSPSGATRYGPAGGAASSEPLLDAPPPSPASASKKAVSVGSVVRDSEDQGRIVSDVLAHLAAIDEARASGSKRSFGRASHVRVVLRRVDRGRAAICVAVTPKDVVRRFLVHEGPGFLVAAVVFALAWIFLVEPRVVPSRSMQPTLMPGDRVVVWKPAAREEPPRWSVVTFRRDDGVVLVKRVVGLPGETILIDEDGDATVAGKILVKPDDVREGVREPLLRSTWEPGPAPDGWADAKDVGPKAYRLWRLLFADEPRADDDSQTTNDRVQIHDLYVDSRIAPTEVTPAEVRLHWARRRESPDRPGIAGVTLRLEKGGRRTLLVEDRAGTTEVLDAEDGPAADGAGPADLSLSYVDGVLRVRVGAWSKKVEIASVPGEAHVDVRGEVTSVAIDRDLHYSRQGNYATESPFEIKAGHVFCLGDHSFNSKDSRVPKPLGPGPVPVSSILGRVVFRIWPPSRIGPIH